MPRYLSKFRDVIGKRQTSQVLSLLNKKRNTGQIKTIEEFNEQLNTLVKELVGTSLKPTLSLYEAEAFDTIDSESHNEMLDRVGDDLEAAFEESINIESVQKSHEALIRDVKFKQLKEAMNSLRKKAAIYKFFETDGQGLTDAMYSTFNDAKGIRANRGLRDDAILFTDPQSSEVYDTENDAVTELAGERLVLPERTVTRHNIASIEQIFDVDAPQSELILEPSWSTITNAIDGTQGTYWLQSLVYANSKEEVKIKVQLDMGGPRTINFIDIEPATKYGILLDEIQYLDDANVVQTLSTTDALITSLQRISFNDISARKITLIFKNKGFRRTEFEYNTNVDTLFSQALSEPIGGYNPDIQNAASDLYNLITNGKIREVLGLSDTSGSNDVFVGFEYLFGLDNIWVGNTIYETAGIYATKPLKITEPGRIALKTIETRPISSFTAKSSITDTSTTYNDTNDANLYHGSIEYYVFKEDFDSEDTLVNTALFSMLPRRATRVNQERLVLNEFSSSSELLKNQGTTRFYTNNTNGNVKVYKNGDELTPVTDWEDASVAADQTPNTGEPMVMRIKILSVTQGDIYTVSYDVLTSTTSAIPESFSQYTNRAGAQIVDMTGNASVVLLDDNSVTLNNELLGREIAYSNFYLMALVRSNSPDLAVTPAVEEFVLAIANKDPDRFEEI